MKNIEGEIPIDVIPPETVKREELENILKEPKFMSCLMVKQPLKKLERNEATAIMFFAEFLVVMILTGAFVLPIPYQPEKYEKTQPGWKIAIILYLGFAGLLVLFFCLAAFKNPGYTKRDQRIDFQRVLDHTDPLNLCPDCKIIRTQRSRHCNICNRCVERFDHHCPYINNCVGHRNHVYFLLFVIFIVVNIAFHLLLTIWSLVEFVEEGNQFPEIFKWVHLSHWDDTIYLIFYFTSVCINLGLGLFFIVPTLLLLWVHSWNFFLNMTTNERYAR